MKVSKKQILVIGIPALICISCILLVPQLVFAENIKGIDLKAIRLYMDDYLTRENIDFLGRTYDKEFFNMLKEYAGINPFKQLYADLGTLDLQIKATNKIIKQNDDLYLLLGGSYGFKYVSPATRLKFLKMAGGIVKSSIKIFIR